MNEKIQSTLRAVLKVLGTVLVTKGIMQEGQIEPVIGAVLTLVGVVWGIMSAHKKDAEK